MSFFIRPFSSADKADLLILMSIHIPEYFAESELSSFEDFLSYHIEKYFILEKNNQIVGCGGINFFLSENKARLSWDMMHPKFLGQNLGTKLLEHRVNVCRNTPGIHKIQVRTSGQAYLFYEKNGFKVHQIISDYWAEGFDLYDMEFLLTTN